MEAEHLRKELEYGIADVARIIEMSRESVRLYIQSGMLPARKEGKSFKVRPADLYEFLKSDRLRRSEVTEGVN